MAQVSPRKIVRLILKTLLVSLAVLSLFSATILRARGENSPNIRGPEKFDVVVYGGTSGGVIAAVKVARMGKSAVLIEPGSHIGGMSASGLGCTDYGNRQAIGGMSLEFYRRLYVYYHGGEIANSGQWYFKPHAAERIFNEMIDESGVTVILGERLDLENGVVFDGNRINAIRMESGRKFFASMFIDATYEGDLMASAQVKYTVGRESNETYGETLNGVRPNSPAAHNFDLPVDPYVIPGEPSSGLIPYVQKDIPGEVGSGDNGVQAYNFRLCMTNVPENRIPWAEPEDYDPTDYELLLRYFDGGLNSIPLHIARVVPNGKSDTNNNGAFSTDFIGMNYEWADADYEKREEIFFEHERYTRGLMWTLMTNPRVPENIRRTLEDWGLSCDEFVDNANWPYILYIREARRMISDYVMTESNCLSSEVANDPVGMGSYQIDSHNVHRFVNESGHVRNEGDVQLGLHEPYAISWRSIIPSIGQCENLLVPVCVSASHVAFGSIRMEPVFMILGESAATAAVISIDTNTSVQDLFYPILREVLTHDGQLLTRTVNPEDLSGRVIDDSQARFIGDWIQSTSVFPYVGEGYVHDDNTHGGKAVIYETRLSRAGNYEVQLFYTAHGNRATNVPIDIYHADGVTRVYVNERITPNIRGMSVSLGEYLFDTAHPAQLAKVEVLNEGADGYVVADAVRFIYMP